MKKIFWLIVCILLFNTRVFANTIYDDNYELNPNYLQGVKYLESSQYSSAINEFKKAIRTNPDDTSSLISLSNAYNLRAVYYNNTMKNKSAAITDIKSALFFVKYFTSLTNVLSQQNINAMEENLKALETSTTPENIFNEAKKLRTQGEFAASGYNYFQLINNPQYSAIAYDSLGDIFKIFNLPKNSVTYYQKSLSINNNSPQTHLKLARTYEKIGDYNSSLNEYNYALNTSDEQVDILSSLERIWQKRADETPNDAEVHSNLGVIFQKQKRFNEALIEYQKAEKLNPANINTKINIGTLYQEQKKYNAAISTYDDILKMQPNSTKVMIYKADCLKELKKNDDAVDLYKKVLNIEPKNSEVKAKIFALMKNTMPTEDVLAFLYKNVQNSPMNSEAYYEFAYELHKADKIDDAITYYNKTIEMDSKKIDAYINLSQAYRQKKNYVEALNTIKKAQLITPNNELVKKQYDVISQEYMANNYNLASNLFQSGEYEKAIEEYKKITPETIDSILGIAASYQSLSNNQMAIEYYKKAMELDKKNIDIPYYIASLYATENDLVNAKQYLDFVLNKKSSHQQAKELLSYITEKQTSDLLVNAVNLYDSQKYEDAIKEFDKVVQITPKDANIYYYRALSYDALKNYEKAIADYKLTLKYNPEMTIIYYSLGVDYDALSNYELAKDNYKKYVELAKEDDDYKKYAQARIDEIN